MTKKEDIVQYWTQVKEESDLAIDWADANERCWRCGYKAKLEKCHIIPQSLGGREEPSNLVLLCFRCHREAPNIDDPRFMWIWLKNTSVPFYDMYWTIKGAEEFKRMFGRFPFHTEHFDEKDQSKLIAKLKKELGKTIVHHGEGRRNPSTIASIMAKIEEEVTGEKLEPQGDFSTKKSLFEFFSFSKSSAAG